MEQSVAGAEFLRVEHGAIREQHGARCRERSDPQPAQGVKGWAPSQIGGQHGAAEAERGAICGKWWASSVEHGVIRDRCNRKTRGPATLFVHRVIINYEKNQEKRSEEGIYAY